MSFRAKSPRKVRRERPGTRASEKRHQHDHQRGHHKRRHYHDHRVTSSWDDDLRPYSRDEPLDNIPIDYGFDHFDEGPRAVRLSERNPANNVRDRQNGRPPNPALNNETQLITRSLPRQPTEPEPPSPPVFYGGYPETKTPEDVVRMNNIDGDQNKSGWNGFERTDKDEEPNKDKHLGARIKRAWASFAENTSVNGIVFIHQSGTLITALLWTLVIVAMVCIAVWQLVTIAKHFTSYPLNTKVSYSYGVLPFPSVTVCNLNKLRSSQLYLAPDLEAFVVSAQDAWNVNISEPGGGIDENKKKRKRKKRDLDGLDEFADGLSDDYFYDYSDYYYDYDGESVFTGETDPFTQTTNYFNKLIGEVPLKTRDQMGHQKELMILKCTFNGKVCYNENFTHTFSKDYGNCYTFNSHFERNTSLVTRLSGAGYGLALELYKEDVEYLSTFTPGGGFRVVVHPFGTLPFPQEDGFSIAPGFQTFIGLSFINVSRPGEPFEECDKGIGFEDEYDSVYTQKACVNTCIDRYITQNCSCFKPENIENYPRDVDLEYDICTDAENTCVSNTTTGVVSGATSCDCRKACLEQNYQARVSVNCWPDYGMWNTIVDNLCEVDENDTACSYYVDNTDESPQNQAFLLGSDFAKLDVYYKDLAYQIIKEEAEYPVSSFVADIGGTVGLWLGLSVFSAFELFSLMSHLVYVALAKDTVKPPAKEKNPRPKGLTIGAARTAWTSNWLATEEQNIGFDAMQDRSQNWWH